MADITIIVANKNYSSWSLRGWLPLKQLGLDFEEVVIPLRQPDTRARILRYTPSAKLPTLLHKGAVVWESLAICEFLAETYPEARLWPDDPTARAQARAISAEMHAGFQPLRQNMPMDMRNSYPGKGMNDAVAADIARIAEIWGGCRAAHGAAGPFLFGHFTAADAMFAPVASRFETYEVALDPVCAAYRDAILSLPALVEWRRAGAAEPWVIQY
jgi:glutathione S-transferase